MDATARIGALGILGPGWQSLLVSPTFLSWLHPMSVSLSLPAWLSWASLCFMPLGVLVPRQPCFCPRSYKEVDSWFSSSVSQSSTQSQGPDGNRSGIVFHTPLSPGDQDSYPTFPFLCLLQKQIHLGLPVKWWQRQRGNSEHIFFPMRSGF